MSEHLDPVVSGARCDADGTLHLFTPVREHRAECQRFAGRCDLKVEVRISKTERTAKQNRAFHAGLGEWAAFKQLSGDAARVWVEDMKDDLLALVFGYTVRQCQKTGAITRRLAEPHTADLNVKQFGELFDVAIVEAAKDGHIWRLPDEFSRPKQVA